MKNVKRVGSLLLSMVMAVMSLCSAPVQAGSFAEARPQWKARTFSGSEEIYLATVQRGYVLTGDGQFLSTDAEVAMFLTENTLCLRFYDAEGKTLTNDTGEDAYSDVIYSVNATGIQEVMGTFYTMAGDDRNYVCGEAEVPGLTISNRQLMVNELMQDGSIDLWLPVYKWNGETDRVLYFSITSADSQFLSLYYEAVQSDWGKETHQEEIHQEGTTTTVTTSFYSNEEVRITCQNYIDRFCDVMPYAQSLYEAFQDDSFTGLLITLMTIGVGLEPFAEFLDAKVAFEGLDTNRMSAEQRSAYLSTKNQVNATDLGMIIQVAEFLNEMGMPH